MFMCFLPVSDLIGQDQQAKLHVKVSAHEAFGITLVEAMTCGCVFRN
jgi:hypothetical protein